MGNGFGKEKERKMEVGLPKQAVLEVVIVVVRRAQMEKKKMEMVR